MSFYRITPDDLENFTIVANPKREFSSSSSGVTGSVRLFARQSQVEKEVQSLAFFDLNAFGDVNLGTVLRQSKFNAEQTATNTSAMEAYLETVNNEALSARLQKELNIIRFEPSFTLTKDSLRKSTVLNHVMPFHRPSMPSGHWAYGNYNTLNFFTASGIPTDSAILYPNSASQALTLASGAYTLTDAFTFDFYINPRYTTDDDITDFKAGTLFHLSSSYAISLVSGSSKDSLGRPDGFRLLLQLSHSADVIPSTAAVGDFPNDLIFLSEDNVLHHNHWHHVAIRWGTDTVDEGTGSFFIDGVERGTFVVPSSSVAPAPFEASGNPDVLVVGNFFEGNNIGTSGQSVFFDSDAATRDGLITLNESISQEGEPASFTFDHPLNAEVHDLKIFNRFQNPEQIKSSSIAGPSSLAGLIFYVPPFFTKESPIRTTKNAQGGVLQTPFFAIDSSTDDPFNVSLSFGVGGHYMNLENFGREFANGVYPRFYQLSGSQITGQTDFAETANFFLYRTGSVRKRNLTVLPCDNGIFTPNFDILKSGTVELSPGSGSVLSKFVTDLGSLDLGLITLNDLVPTSSIRKSVTAESGSIFNTIAGATPDNLGVDPGEVLTILQRTRDNTSNEVVFFDITNLFYGNRINPGSFEITDNDLSGSGGRVSITLKDDGLGNVHRADALTAHATWNSVGNIFYNEGIAVVKSPHLPFFGTDQWEMKFEGEQTIHVLKISVNAAAGLVNSSSNPNFKLVSASLEANDADSEFVYISNIFFLDNNLNVIMKTNLSQPVKKRSGDKILFRSKIDF